MKARIYAPDERPEVVADDPGRGWLDGELGADPSTLGDDSSDAVAAVLRAAEAANEG